MRLHELDLNLLRVFEAVLEEGSITAAASRIGLTQSATSNALQRLRDHCRDALFVRTTRGMQPTPYGKSLAEPILTALRSIRETLGQSSTFDPRTSERVFTVVTTDIGQLLLMQKMAVVLRKEAPRLSVSFVRASRDKYREALESGADLAFGQLPPGHADFVQQHLFDDELVCFVRRDHPRIRGPITVQQFVSEPQIIVGPPALTDLVVRKALGRKARKRLVVLEAASHLALPPVVAQSDFIAVTTHSLVDIFAKPFGLRELALPFPAAPIRVCQFWHPRMQKDAGHRWLREAIAKEQWTG